MNDSMLPYDIAFVKGGIKINFQDKNFIKLYHHNTQVDDHKALLLFYEMLKEIIASDHTLSKEGRKYNNLLKIKAPKLAHNKKHFEKMYQLWHHSYILGAQMGVFDDYMIAVEWNRKPEEKFWQPRRNVLQGKHKVASTIQDFLDSKLDDALYLAISMPPGTGKSTLLKFLLSFSAGLAPNDFSLYVANTTRVSEMVYDGVSTILTDSAYLHNMIFPSRPPKLNSERKTINFGQRGNFATLTFTSLESKLAGGTRATHLLVTDDLVEGADSVMNHASMDRIYEKYTSDVFSRSMNVKQIMLGTLWSPRDPICRIMAQQYGDTRYRQINIPIEDENGESNFEYDPIVGNARYTKDTIDIIKATIEPYDYQCKYMGNPIEREGLIFPYDELKYYLGVLPDGEPDNILFFCDVAWGATDHLSMPIAYQYGEDIYIHDVVFDNGDKHVTKPRVLAKIIQHNIKMGRFEANAGGHEYADDINKELRQKHGYYCNISHKQHGNTSKAMRIEMFAPDIKNFYFIDSKPFAHYHCNVCNNEYSGQNEKCPKCNSEDVNIPKRVYRSDDYRQFMRELTSMTWASFESKSRAKKARDDAADSLAGLADFALNRRNRRASVTFLDYRLF